MRLLPRRGRAAGRVTRAAESRRSSPCCHGLFFHFIVCGLQTEVPRPLSSSGLTATRRGSARSPPRCQLSNVGLVHVVSAWRGSCRKLLGGKKKRISNPSFRGVCSGNPHETTSEWFWVEGTLKDHLDPTQPVLQGITTTVPCPGESQKVKLLWKEGKARCEPSHPALGKGGSRLGAAGDFSLGHSGGWTVLSMFSPAQRLVLL